MTDNLNTAQTRLIAIHSLLATMPSPAADYQRYRQSHQALNKHRRVVASFVGATYLKGATFDMKPVHHDGASLLDNVRLPRELRAAVAAVPNLCLDHVYLFKLAGKPIAVATMPYDHRPD